MLIHIITGLENEPPPPGLDAEEVKNKASAEEGECKEDKHGEKVFQVTVLQFGRKISGLQI